MIGFVRHCLNYFAASGDRGPADPFWYQTVMAARPTAAAVRVDEEIALTYSAVWAATRLLCGTGAWLPLKVYRRVEKHGGEGREHLRTHPVQRLLKRPNDSMSGMAFRLLMWKWQVNRGNAYAEIQSNRLGPQALLPLDPQLVDCRRDDDGTVFYEYREPLRESRRIEADAMLHIPSIISVDGVSGKGVIEHARESIGFGIATEKHGAHFFGHGALPPMVVEHPGRWDDPQRAAFRREWAEIYGGATGAKVGVLGGGATAKMLQLTERDSQFLETRQHNIEEIARWYGVPPHMLQHLLRATWNNIELLGIEFVVYSLILWLSIWEEQIELKLLKDAALDDGLFVEHSVNALLRGDTRTRGEYYRAMVSLGLMTRNEVRALENLDPVEGGDVFLVQGASVPLNDDGKPESEFVGTAGPDQGGTEPDAPQEPADRKAAAAKTCIVQALSRMLTKESDRALRAAKDADAFIDWLDGFYAEHLPDVAANVSPLFEMAGIPNAEAFASRWCEAGRNALLDVSGTATPDKLRDAVAAHVHSAEWISRPAAAVFHLEA